MSRASNLPVSLPVSALDQYFEVTETGPNIPQEIRAAITTFLTMSYILFVSPQVLSSAIKIDNAFVPLLVTPAIRLAGDG